MRDLLFKNLTSSDKRRKIITSSEVTEKQGVRTEIHRHFVSIVKEVKDKQLEKPLSYIYVLRARNNKEQKERFFCRIKGSMYLVNNGKLFLVLFMHSLKISLIVTAQDSLKYSE
jgi:hypothetical protein